MVVSRISTLTRWLVGTAVLVVACAAVFSSLDAYLLTRAERAQENQERVVPPRIIGTLEEEFEPIAEQVIEDVHQAIEAEKRNNARALEESDSTPLHHTPTLPRPEILVTLMREAVVSYEDAGDYAQYHRYDIAYAYLVEAEVLFEEFLSTSEVYEHVSHPYSHVEGIRLIRESATHFLRAVQGAKYFVQGKDPRIDIAEEDARARSLLRQGRTLIQI